MIVYRNKILSQNHLREMRSSILEIEGVLFVCLIFLCNFSMAYRKQDIKG